MNLMIVEDSEIVRVVLRQLLVEVPHAVVTGEFEDATSAVAGIQENPPDLLLLDIELRQGNGLEVLQAIKVTHPTITVFVVTNYADAIFADRYLSAGASAFFDKSRQLGVLRNQLQTLSRRLHDNRPAARHIRS